jgi:hypothetical protein
MSPEAAKIRGDRLELDYHSVPRVGIAFPGQTGVGFRRGGLRWYHDIPVAEEAAVTAEAMGKQSHSPLRMGSCGNPTGCCPTFSR